MRVWTLVRQSPVVLDVALGSYAHAAILTAERWSCATTRGASVAVELRCPAGHGPVTERETAKRPGPGAIAAA